MYWPFFIKCSLESRVFKYLEYTLHVSLRACLKDERERERDLTKSWAECILTLPTAPQIMWNKWRNTWGKCFCFPLSSLSKGKGAKTKAQIHVRFSPHFIGIWTCLRYLTLSMSHSHTPLFSVCSYLRCTSSLSVSLSFSLIYWCLPVLFSRVARCSWHERMNIWQSLPIWQYREWEKWFERKEASKRKSLLLLHWRCDC